MENERIAYCGVSCEECSDYTQNKCPGCRQTDWSDGDECMPAACCRKQGISACGQCPAFPCADMKDFYQESESHQEAFERMKAMQ